MKTPPLLLGAALVFWGWQGGYLVFGLIMAGLLESSRITRWRFEFSALDCNRISDGCAIIFVALSVYRYSSGLGIAAIWVPLALFPLALAQAYSGAAGVSAGAIFWTIRQRIKKGAPVSLIDFTYPYFALTILATTGSTAYPVLLYPGVFILSLWALWPVRPRRYPVIIWVFLMIMVGMAGWAGHIGLHRAHLWLESRYYDWLVEFMTPERDPYRNTMALGDIGELKLSDKIVFRVETEPGQKPPGLLGEASYNLYLSRQWLACQPGFKIVNSQGNHLDWVLGPGMAAPKVITVYDNMIRNKAVLKLPAGAFALGNLPVLSLRINEFGAVKVEDGPDLMAYKVFYGPVALLYGPPDRMDLEIPDQEKQALEQTVLEMALPRGEKGQVLTGIKKFFLNNFNYSLFQTETGSGQTPLSHFLLKSRSGHCEFFATATVLLLRAHGIPARYMAGYMVDEYSGLEKMYIVRSRHAHAWALAYVDGAWQNLDTTPPSWLAIEAQASSFWSPIRDYWGWLIFKYSQWRLSGKNKYPLGYLVWPVIPLIIFLLIRLKARKKTRPAPKKEIDPTASPRDAKTDSPFYRIEERLVARGFTRKPYQTLPDWIKDLETAGPDLPLETLRTLTELHYRLRFDPKGLAPAERASFEEQVDRWLARDQKQ